MYICIYHIHQEGEPLDQPLDREELVGGRVVEESAFGVRAHVPERTIANEPKQLKGALQLLIHRYGSVRFAHVQVHERVSTKSFVLLSIENSKSNHLGAQSTFKGARGGSHIGLDTILSIPIPILYSKGG